MGHEGSDQQTRDKKTASAEPSNEAASPSKTVDPIVADLTAALAACIGPFAKLTVTKELGARTSPLSTPDDYRSFLETISKAVSDDAKRASFLEEGERLLKQSPEERQRRQDATAKERAAPPPAKSSSKLPFLIAAVLVGGVGYGGVTMWKRINSGSQLKQADMSPVAPAPRPASSVAMAGKQASPPAVHATVDPARAGEPPKAAETGAATAAPAPAEPAKKTAEK